MDLHFWLLIFGSLAAVAILYAAVQRWKSCRYRRFESLSRTKGRACMVKNVWGINRRGLR